MAYMLPLRYIRVGPDVSICATKIAVMMSTKCYQARQTLKVERENKTLINACGKLKAKTAIFLDNGTVVSSPLTIARLQTAIDKANSKATDSASPKYQRGLKVYDIADPQPDPQSDDWSDQLSSFSPYESEDDEYDEEEVDEDDSDS